MSPDLYCPSIASQRVIVEYENSHDLPPYTYIYSSELRDVYRINCKEDAEVDEIADYHHAESLSNFFAFLDKTTEIPTDFTKAYKRFLRRGENCPEESPAKAVPFLKANYDVLAHFEKFDPSTFGFFFLKRREKNMLLEAGISNARSVVALKELSSKALKLSSAMERWSFGPKELQVLKIIASIILSPSDMQIIWGMASNPSDGAIASWVADVIKSDERILGVKLLLMISGDEDGHQHFPPRLKELVEHALDFNINSWSQKLESHFGDIIEDLQSSPVHEYFIGKRIVAIGTSEDEIKSADNFTKSRYRSLLVMVHNGERQLVKKFLGIINGWHDENQELLDIWIHLACHLAVSKGLGEMQRSIVEAALNRFEFYNDGTIDLRNVHRTTYPYIFALLDPDELRKMNTADSLQSYLDGFKSRHPWKTNGSGGNSGTPSSAPPDFSPPDMPTPTGGIAAQTSWIDYSVSTSNRNLLISGVYRSGRPQNNYKYETHIDSTGTGEQALTAFYDVGLEYLSAYASSISAEIAMGYALEMSCPAGAPFSVANNP